VAYVEGYARNPDAAPLVGAETCGTHATQTEEKPASHPSANLWQLHPGVVPVSSLTSYLVILILVTQTVAMEPHHDQQEESHQETVQIEVSVRRLAKPMPPSAAACQLAKQHRRRCRLMATERSVPRHEQCVASWAPATQLLAEAIVTATPCCA